MICSALGTFWPGPAPGTFRLYESMPYRIEAPLTDTEVGVGTMATSWDGATPPPIISGSNVIFPNVNFIDYVRQGRFSVQPFMNIDTRAYIARVLAMFNSLYAVGVVVPGGTDRDNKNWRSEAETWRVLLFKEVSGSDPGFQQAYNSITQARPPLAQPIYQLRLVQLTEVDDPVERRRLNVQFNQVLATIDAGQDYSIYALPSGLLVNKNNAGWQAVPVPRRT